MAAAAKTAVYILCGGVDSPVGASDEVTRLLGQGWEEAVGGKLEFEPNEARVVEKALAHIDHKRAALGLVEYDPQRFAKPDVTRDAVMGYTWAWVSAT